MNDLDAIELLSVCPEQLIGIPRSGKPPLALSGVDSTAKPSVKIKLKNTSSQSLP